jgi:P27 family predicted phage terminase small subunit
MPGPPPKPIALKLLQGNPGHETKAKLNRGPKWNRGFGSCPRWLPAEARKLWRKLAPQLEAKNLSAAVYRPALEGLCTSYARALTAEAVLGEKGLTMAYTTEAGACYEQQRPEVAIAAKAWAAVKGFCAEFGLTPAAVGRVSVARGSEKSLAEIARERAIEVRRVASQEKNKNW